LAQGNVEAWFQLGAMHLRGAGGLKASAAQALSFWTLAAKMGHTLAQYDLAMLRLQGADGDKCARACMHATCPGTEHPHMLSSCHPSTKDPAWG
jgi:TPR repeat protein